jgi:tRNA U34 2-thiouridine synthase MnmA/TrmU
MLLKKELHEIKLSNMAAIILKEESYQIIGLCMEVHRELGIGCKEIVYKDAWNMNSKQETYPIPVKKIMKSNIKISYSHVVITLTS